MRQCIISLTFIEKIFFSNQRKIISHLPLIYRRNFEDRMRKFYQTDWFGIPFKGFCKISSRTIANLSFYDKFYEEFDKKFSSYEDLPQEWLLNKNLIVDFILKQTNKGDRLLSIGSGIGYIEYNLKNSGRNIVAIEPSQKASNFLRKFSKMEVYTGFFPSCLSEEKKAQPYDLSYMVAVDYVFKNKEFISLLKEIKKLSAKRFLLISASIYKNKSLPQTFKDALKSLLSYLSLYELGQFWGYQRRPEDFLYIFKQAGFTDIEYGFQRKDIFWIRGN